MGLLTQRSWFSHFSKPTLAAPSTLRIALSPSIYSDYYYFNYIWPFAVRFAEIVKAKTNGALLIEAWDARSLATGQAPDLQISSVIFRKRRLPEAELLTMLPREISAEIKFDWLHSHDVEQAWNELYSPLGIKPIAFGLSGISLANVSRKEIRSIEDLSDLRVGATGAQGSPLLNLGVDVPLSRVTDTAQMIAAGEIDITPSLPHSVHEHLATYKNRLYYQNSWTPLCVPYELAMTARKWNKLPVEFQLVIQRAAHSVGREMFDSKQKLEALAFANIAKEAPSSIRSFPDDVVNAIAKQEAQIARSLGQRNEPSARLLALRNSIG